MRLKTILIGVVGVVVATGAEARGVTRVWHVVADDPSSTLCKESRGGRVIITSETGSAARLDDPTPSEWRRAGCEASRPNPAIDAEVDRIADRMLGQMLAQRNQPAAPTPTPQQ